MGQSAGTTDKGDRSERRIPLEELAMLRFLELCQPSLDSPGYAATVDACEYLREVRNDLDAGSLQKCLDYLKSP
jgi:hypothetical protein